MFSFLGNKDDPPPEDKADNGGGVDATDTDVEKVEEPQNDEGKVEEGQNDEGKAEEGEAGKAEEATSGGFTGMFSFLSRKDGPRPEDKAENGGGVNATDADVEKVEGGQNDEGKVQEGKNDEGKAEEGEAGKAEEAASGDGNKEKEGQAGDEGEAVQEPNTDDTKAKNDEETKEAPGEKRNSAAGASIEGQPTRRRSSFTGTTPADRRKSFSQTLGLGEDGLKSGEDKKLELLGTFPKDCGPNRTTKLFSYQKAVYERLLRMPHIKERVPGAATPRPTEAEREREVTFVPEQASEEPARKQSSKKVVLGDGAEQLRVVPLRQDFGQHLVPGWTQCTDRVCSCCPGVKARAQKDEQYLEENFGVAVALYFKWIKYMMGCFVWLTLISTPAMVFYSYGSSLSTAEIDTYISANPFNALFLLTIGSLGETAVTCKETSLTGASLTLQCDSSAQSITDVHAYFGQPEGTCSCPSDQEYDVSDGCPDDASADGSCADGEYCIEGLTEFDEYCCASSRSDGAADFSDLEVGAGAGCNSDAVQLWLETACLGENACTVSGSRLWAVGASVANATLLAAELEDAGGFTATTNFTECAAGTDLTLTLVYECQSSDLDVPGSSTSVKKSDLATLAAYLDAVGMFVFLILCAVLYRLQRDTEENYDGAVCSAEDYTVEVSGLPSSSNHAELEGALRAHFETLLNLTDITGERKKYAHTIDATEEVKVADVNMGLSISKEVSLMTKRGKVARKLDELRNFLVILREREKDTAAQEKKVKKYELRFDKLNNQLEANHAKQEALTHERVNRAFVTFETEEGYLRCLKAYSKVLPGLSMCAAQELKLKFHKQGEQEVEKVKAISVRPSCQPDDIVWENIEHQTWTRYIRLFISFAITIAILLISFALIYVGKYEKQLLADEYSTDCSNYVVITEKNSNWTGYGDYLTPEETVELTYYEELGLDSGDTGAIQCFCYGAISDLGFSASLDYMFNTSAVSGLEAQTAMCEDWFYDLLYIQTLTIGSIMLVLAVNIILKSICKVLVDFEKHYNRSGKVTSLTWKLFLAQFVNIAMIALLVNGNLDLFGVSVQSVGYGEESWSIFSGSYDDFGTDWYLDIGVTLMLTMIINAFSPHASTIGMMFFQGVKICKDRKGCIHKKEITSKFSQTDLDSLYAGPEFELEMRYASLLMTVFVTLTYGAGLPLLYPICFLSFVVYYMVDKWLFLRFYSKPPQMSGKLADFAANVLPYAIFLHVSFAMWMFSNEDIFPETDSSLTISTGSSSAEDITGSSFSFSSRLFNSNNILNMAMWLCIFLYILIRQFLWPLVRYNLSFFCCCIYQYCKQLEPIEGNAPYWQSLPKEHIIKHLHLQILQENIINKYKEELDRRDEEERGSDAAARKNPDGSELRELRGNPSYNYIANEAYLRTFALETDCIVRYNTEHQDFSSFKNAMSADMLASLKADRKRHSLTTRELGMHVAAHLADDEQTDDEEEPAAEEEAAADPAEVGLDVEDVPTNPGDEEDQA